MPSGKKSRPSGKKPIKDAIVPPAICVSDRNASQIIENFNSDHSSSAGRSEFANHVACFAGTTLEEFEKHCRKFLDEAPNQFRFQGKPIAKHHSLVFGHTKRSKHWITQVREVVKDTEIQDDFELFAKSMNDTGRESDSMLVALKEFEIVPKNVTIWAFFNPMEPHSPRREASTEIALEQLPCRLGMGDQHTPDIDVASDGEWMYLEYRLPTDTLPPNEPTFFDARYYRFWRPGGFTEPLRDCVGPCKTLPGLPEAVQRPTVKFKDSQD